MAPLTFSDVLEAARRDTAEAGEVRHAVRLLWFTLPFGTGVASDACGAPRSQLARRYAGASTARTPVPVDAATIAHELGVDASSSRCELGEARRRFAVRNHPDRAPPQLKELATARMAIVNELIDGWIESGCAREIRSN
jgi:hypothetical protein